MAAEQDLYFDAEVSVFKINDGTLRNISPYINELRGLPGQYKMHDLTTHGSVGERPAPGLQTNRLILEMLFNMVTDVGTWTVLKNLWNNTTLAPFAYYPAGEVTDNPKITGNAYLAIFEITGRVGNQASVHAELAVNNGVTLGAVSA